MAMVRKQVYVSPSQEKKLRAAARSRGISEAAVIRELVDRHCSAETTLTDDAARDRFLKMLRDQQKQARRYKGPDIDRKFNREEAYEERLERQMPR